LSGILPGESKNVRKTAAVMARRVLKQTTSKSRKMKTTWIIHTNMGEQSDIDDYVKAVKATGSEVIEVNYKAFSGEYPRLKIEGPVVVYGAVNFVKAIQESGLYPNSVFGDPETFTYEAWARNYGDMLLNSSDGTELTTVGRFSAQGRSPDEDIFVRPQHDTKTLVGRVWTVEEFEKWCAVASGGSFADVNADTPVVVAVPYGIEAEWRLFVVDGKVVTASQYQKRGRQYRSEGAPGDILLFAEKVIERWNPAPAFTLDLCRSAGNPYIVEAQGFNSAGQYLCDVVKLARAVNELAVKLWSEHAKKTDYRLSGKSNEVINYVCENQ
jgi:hypothetical protein